MIFWTYSYYIFLNSLNITREWKRNILIHRWTVFSYLKTILHWQLQLRDEQGTSLLHLLFVRSYMCRPITTLFFPSPSSFWWSVVSVGQAADLSWSCLLQFWSKCSVVCQSDVPSLAFYVFVRSTGCFMLSVSQLSLDLAYSKDGRHLSLDLAS